MVVVSLNWRCHKISDGGTHNYKCAPPATLSWVVIETNLTLTAIFSSSFFGMCWLQCSRSSKAPIDQPRKCPRHPMELQPKSLSKSHCPPSAPASNSQNTSKPKVINNDRCHFVLCGSETDGQSLWGTIVSDQRPGNWHCQMTFEIKVPLTLTGFCLSLMCLLAVPSTSSSFITLKSSVQRSPLPIAS